jgi:SAM-dependent methyltransferase
VNAVPRDGSLLDLGTSDGSTLVHFAELRPDISFAAVDLNPPQQLPPGTDFRVVDLNRESFPWPDNSFDAITCMHLVEHLVDRAGLWRECARVLKPDGKVYVETPGPLSLSAETVTGPAAGSVTMNFFDDPTHIDLVPIGALEREAAQAGLRTARSGKSRNWLFVLAYPLLALLRPNTRARYVAKLHWMGWSHYIIAAKPITVKNPGITA